MSAKANLGVASRFTAVNQNHRTPLPEQRPSITTPTSRVRCEELVAPYGPYGGDVSMRAGATKRKRPQTCNPDQKRAPISLLSKSDYNKPSPGYQKRASWPNHCAQSPRVDRRHPLPIIVADDQPSLRPISCASITSPKANGPSPVSSNGNAIKSITAPCSIFPEGDINSPYGRINPLYDPTRQGPSSAHASQPLLNPPLSNASANRPRTQKEEMLAGRAYLPFDKELVLERERCSAACWRFNNSNDPTNRVSPGERSRLFRAILLPPDPITAPSEASALTPISRVGDEIIVEAPFNCDYGYKITIGQDVVIGKNCTILDCGGVLIGDRCNIGPNVNIYTTTLPVEPGKRAGSLGSVKGQKIIIGSDCWIGGGVTILPGKTIGKGSVVGAGSVVTKVCSLADPLYMPGS